MSFNILSSTVFVDAGSRYEVRYTSGVSHLMSKLAFNSTERFEHREAISDVIHDRGGIMDCQPFRDTIVYGVSLFSDSVEQAVEVLAEALWRPRLTAEEVLIALSGAIWGISLVYSSYILNTNRFHLFLAINQFSNTQFVCPVMRMNTVCYTQVRSVVHKNKLAHHFSTCYTYVYILKSKRPIRELNLLRLLGEDTRVFFFSTGPDSSFWKFHPSSVTLGESLSSF